MFGLNALEILLIAVLLVIGFVWLSRGPLANVLRSKAKAKELELAKALDDANDRVSASQVETEEKLVTGEAGKVTVKSARKLIEVRYNEAKAAFDKWDLAAQNSAMHGRTDLVEKAVARKQAAEKTMKGLKPALDQLVTSEGKVVDSVQVLKERKAALKVDQQVIKGRSTAATTGMSVDQMIAGLNADGTDDNLAKAYEILEEAEAKAGAWQEMADEVKNAKKLDDELEEMASGGPKGNEVAEYMAKYGPKVEGK